MEINTLNKKTKSKVILTISNFSKDEKTALKQQKTIKEICQSLYNVYKHVNYNDIIYYLNHTELKVEEKT